MKYDFKIGDRVFVMGCDGKIRHGEIELFYNAVDRSPMVEVYMDTEGYVCYPISKLFRSKDNETI
jgi:3,4-dihydroxy-2-butanone 4-phosphate synthase